MITWDVSADGEDKLTEQLYCDFEAVCLDYSAKLKAADLASKTYCNHTTPLLGITFAEEELVYHR